MVQIFNLTTEFLIPTELAANEEMQKLEHNQ